MIASRPVPAQRCPDRPPHHRRQLPAAPAGHVGHGPSRQRPGPAGRARARGVGVPAAARRCSRRARADARRVRLCDERRGHPLRPRSGPVRGRLQRAARDPGRIAAARARREHAVADAPDGPLALPAAPAARRRGPAGLRLRRAAGRHVLRQRARRAGRRPAAAPGRPARERHAHHERRAEAEGLVRPFAQRRRRDRLPGPQGPAAAHADARPPRLRRAPVRPPRRGRKRRRADLMGLGRRARPQGRGGVPATAGRRRARPDRRARAVRRRRADDRGRRVDAGAEGRRVRRRRHASVREAVHTPGNEVGGDPVQGLRDPRDRYVLQPAATAQPQGPGGEGRPAPAAAHVLRPRPGRRDRAQPGLPPRGRATPKTLWEIPGAGHVGGIRAQPAEYERRVVGFFDDALL